jgi:superfamily II DNA/RNA helicase
MAEPVYENTVFGNMGLLPELCKALSDMKITTPTTIQEASLPLSLAGEP